MSPRKLQNEIKQDFRADNSVWSSYKNSIASEFAQINYQDLSDHLLREFNRKIVNLGLSGDLMFAPFDAGFRFTGSSIDTTIPSALLDFYFAEDRTIVPRIGATPSFARASIGNYYGPNRIVVNDSSTPITQNTSIVNGRTFWASATGGPREYDYQATYNGTRWAMRIRYWIDGEEYEETNYLAALGSEWRPEDADWSGTGITVVAGNTFGIVRAATDEPRFEYDPVTLECLGWLVEDSSTNYVFPSATLTSQIRTTIATTHTLSFYGTGTVTLSGTHSATIVGTGATTRTTYTFSPNFGSLSLTVTGSVTSAQLERKSAASSYIETVSGTVTRSADVLQYTDISSFYNETAGVLFCQLIVKGISSDFSSAWFGGPQNGIRMQNSDSLAGVITNDEQTQFSNTIGSVAYGASRKAAMAFQDNGSAIICLNGTLGTQDDEVLLPTSENGGIEPTNLALFTNQNSIIKSFRYYSVRLSNSQLQTLTSP
jgi:hypothetical protein